MALPGASLASPVKSAEPAPSEAERALYLAYTEHQAGRLEAAIGWYRRAVTLQRGFPEALNDLGIALKDLRRFDEAVTAYREALGLRPDLAEIWNNLGDALHSLGDRATAIEHYRRALAIDPSYALCWRNLGDALLEDGAEEEANECFHKAATFAPDLDASLSPTELGLRETQRYFAVLDKKIEAALSRDPQLAACYRDWSFGKGLPAGSDAATAERYRLAARFRTSYADSLSSLLLALHYDSAAPPAWLSAAHGEVERLHGGLPRFTAWANSREPERRLRIGYVSADFRRHHSVGYFLAAIFAAHDPTAVDTYCYSGSADDEETSFFRARAGNWRATADMSDETLARAIRDDAIDILVDLSGHTYGNRLAAFARHPAPVQVSWLGYPDTTGLTAIDYRFTDAIVDPPGTADALTSERLFRLPQGFHCYTAPDEAPDIAPSPRAGGDVTFGSLNNLIKVNAAVLDAWAAILKRVPRSRLLVKARWLDLAEMRRRILDNFERRGVARDRIELLSKLPSVAEHLAIYGRVDIALDTFPYNGVTTTCEALWMGVPVVTLAGDRHAARVGASLLSQVGLGELVATSLERYVETAARLAADFDRRAALHASLRDHVKASPLGDSAGFTRRLEAAYRTMWRAWCGQQA